MLEVENCAEIIADHSDKPQEKPDTQLEINPYLDSDFKFDVKKKPIHLYRLLNQLHRTDDNFMNKFILNYYKLSYEDIKEDFDSQDEILECLKKQYMFTDKKTRQVEYIKICLDACYMKYMWHWDKDIPVDMLPIVLDRINLHRSLVLCKETEIYECIKSIISSDFVKQIYRSNTMITPPLQVIYDIDVLKEQQDILKPMVKKLVELIIRL